MLVSRTGASRKLPGFFRQNHIFNIPFWGTILTVFLILANLAKPTFFEYFSYKLYDELLLRTARGQASEQIVIVDIDEKSLKAHGQWPWPRYKIAAIVETLNESGALAISLDMMFPERDRTSLNIIQAELKRDLGLDLSVSGMPAHFDNDRRLADAISRSAAVLGYQFLFGDGPDSAQCQLHPLQISEFESFPSSLPSLTWNASQAACNLEIFAQATPHMGFLNASPDQDGILRKVPLIMEYQGRYYPSLALSTVLRALRIDQVGLHKGLNAHVLSLDKIDKMDKISIPLNPYGSILVNYRGKARTFKYISAGDLLAGRFAEDCFRNKIVFVGTSAAGFKEFRSTPVEPLFPGVEIHATVTDNLLKGDYLSHPAYAGGAEILASLFIGLIYVLFIARADALKSLMVSILAATALLGFSICMFTTERIFFSPVLPVMVLFFDFSVLNLLKYRQEEDKSRQHNADLVQAQAAVIESMAALTETRDPETGKHIKRTQEYVRLLANALMKHPKFKSILDSGTVDLLYKSAPLHDIGKVGVSDSILYKPGELSPEEFDEMKRHTIIGRDVIAATQSMLGDQYFLRIAHEIAYTHHEKWDGTGYPQGLKGEEIPLSGRLMAVADTYEALTTRRVYKPAQTHDEALRIMTTEERDRFDPDILEVFMGLSDVFRDLAQKYIDSDPVDNKDIDGSSELPN